MSLHSWTLQKKIVLKLPGIRPNFVRLTLTENEANIFPTGMLLIIGKHTNHKFATIRQKYKHQEKLD